jgi:hypothetical protein
MVANPPLQTVNAASTPNGEPLSGTLMQATPLSPQPNSDRGELTQAPDAVTDIPNAYLHPDWPVFAIEAAARHEAERSFGSRDFELHVTAEKSKPNSDPDTCVYPDSYLRTPHRGEDGCGVVEPDVFASQIFGLPFLALTAWVLAILAAAGSSYFLGDWRSRR